MDRLVDLHEHLDLEFRIDRPNFGAGIPVTSCYRDFVFTIARQITTRRL